MAKDDIRLSPRYGLNPSLGTCPICGEENGEIILHGLLKNDQEAPRHTWTLHPCSECKDKLASGVGLVEIIDRTRPSGSAAILTAEAYCRLFTSPVPPERIACVDHPTLTNMLKEQTP